MLLVPIGTSRVGQAAQVPPQRDFAAWRHAVESHAAGRRDAAVVGMARWTYRELMAVLPDVARLEADVRMRLVRRALVLHTDTAIAHRRGAGYDLPPHGTPSMVFADGKMVAEASATFHWDFARALIARLPRGQERTDTARLFYRATGAVMQSWWAHTELDDHLAAGAREIGPDAVLLLYEGARHHLYAHPRARAAFDEWRRQTEARLTRSRATGMMARDQRSVASSQLDAEKALRQALTLDATLHEARIRLAHVLNDRARHAEALDQIEAAAASLSPMLRFYFHLVRGRAERGLDRLQAARSSFEAARALMPHAHAPLLALSEVALALGDQASAREYLAVLSANVDGSDPWALLARTHDGAEEMLSRMRQEF
jgi:tetratricopeptide (TPR) repeat protein